MCVVFCFIVSGHQYQCNRLPGKTRLRNELLCVEWDVKPCSLTHSCWNTTSLLLLVGSTSADTAADVRQPTDDRYTAVNDCRTSWHGAAGHAGADADPSASDATWPASPSSNDAGLYGRPRGQRRSVDSCEFHRCRPVAARHICGTFDGRRVRSAAKCRAAGTATATAENHLVWSVLSQDFLCFGLQLCKCNPFCFASAVVAVDSGHMTASSSALWSVFGPP